MSQQQELEAIDRFVIRFKPTNTTQQKLIQDWKVWYSNQSWFNRNMNQTTIEEARAFRNALQGNFGAETSTAGGNYKKPGTQVPIPNGYRRAKLAEISPQVQSFAKAALANFAQVSKKKGEPASIGMRYSAVVNGKQYLSQCEWHFDNHPKGGKGDPFWHMGSSIFVPTNPIPKELANQPAKVAAMFKTSDPSLAALQTNNPYA